MSISLYSAGACGRLRSLCTYAPSLLGTITSSLAGADDGTALGVDFDIAAIAQLYVIHHGAVLISQATVGHCSAGVRAFIPNTFQEPLADGVSAWDAVRGWMGFSSSRGENSTTWRPMYFCLSRDPLFIGRVLAPSKEKDGAWPMPSEGCCAPDIGGRTCGVTPVRDCLNSAR
jgi:hypothetical protein